MRTLRAEGHVRTNVCRASMFFFNQADQSAFVISMTPRTSSSNAFALMEDVAFPANPELHLAATCPGAYSTMQDSPERQKFQTFEYSALVRYLLKRGSWSSRPCAAICTFVVSTHRCEPQAHSPARLFPVATLQTTPYPSNLRALSTTPPCKCRAPSGWIFLENIHSRRG